MVLVALGVALSACGGATKSSPGQDSSPQGGTSSDAGSSGSVSGGGARAGASSGGSRPVEPEGGSSGSGGAGNPLDCDDPYSGAAGGPRADGPELIVGACDAIPQDVLIARFESVADRVPKGLYYEPDGPITLWQEPCARAPEEAMMRGAGGLEALFTTPWFYEAAFCDDGPRRSVRSLRCDYFDGIKLSEPTRENLVFLASLRWWAQNHDSSGTALLGYSVTTIGSATDWIELCTLRGVAGDFGLCDEITVERTEASIRYDGEVKLGQPERVSVVQGNCH